MVANLSLEDNPTHGMKLRNTAPGPIGYPDEGLQRSSGRGSDPLYECRISSFR